MLLSSENKIKSILLMVNIAGNKLRDHLPKPKATYPSWKILHSKNLIFDDVIDLKILWALFGHLNLPTLRSARAHDKKLSSPKPIRNHHVLSYSYLQFSNLKHTVFSIEVTALNMQIILKKSKITYFTQVSIWSGFTEPSFNIFPRPL